MSRVLKSGLIHDGLPGTGTGLFTLYIFNI